MAEIAIDPICKMEVDINNPAATWEYKGTMYYFCMEGCKTRFMSDPERFLGSKSAEPMPTKGWKRFFKR